MNNLLIILCLVYIKVYLVLSIYNKPNFEFFEPSENDLLNLEPSSSDASSNNNNSEKLIDLVTQEIEKNKKMFLEQQDHQNRQDNDIAEFKQQVDSLRNDLIQYRKQESNDSNNIHTSIKPNDSVSQMLSASGGKNLSNSLNGFGNAGSKGKNYNLNFNLQD